MALHRKGRLSAAEALCRQIPERDPAHVDALQLLGVIAYVAAVFRDHAVCYLLAGAFEAHDKTRFEAFASRMAGSLLRAVGLPELITHDLGDYEALALKLATTPGLLADLRARLAANRTASSLFDTTLSCRHLEPAYRIMRERQQSGMLPTDSSVAAQFTSQSGIDP